MTPGLRRFALLALLAIAPAAAHAIEITISAKALERTLQKQLFNGPNGRYYMRGNATSACYVYAEDPKVSFANDRVVVHVKTHAKLGTSLHGACLGVALNTEGDMSVVPDAQGENIGFRDPRVEHLSEFHEVNYFLEPFLTHKLPQKLTVNAADLVRQLLSTSTQSMGYDLKLTNLKIHSMQVSGNALVVDIDGALSVQ
jgi:hypothetical protein